MNNIMTDSIFFGAVISVVGYLIGIFLRKKISVFHPVRPAQLFHILNRQRTWKQEKRPVQSQDNTFQRYRPGRNAPAPERSWTVPGKRKTRYTAPGSGSAEPA